LDKSFSLHNSKKETKSERCEEGENEMIGKLKRGRLRKREKEEERKCKVKTPAFCWTP
jgi:hypothetical protein